MNTTVVHIKKENLEKLTGSVHHTLYLKTNNSRQNTVVHFWKGNLDEVMILLLHAWG
jgi:hypothetical protein